MGNYIKIDTTKENEHMKMAYYWYSTNVLTRAALANIKCSLAYITQFHRCSFTFMVIIASFHKYK